MVQEEKVEEIVVDKVQQNEINDILDSFVPTQVEQDIKSEEVIDSGDKRKERTEEETVKQVETDSGTKEGEKEVAPSETKEVVPPVEGVKPTTEVQPPPESQKSETELELARRELAELRAQLSETAARMMDPPVQKVKTEAEVAADKVQRERAARQVLPFLQSDEVFDEVMKSSANFNALLTSVVNTAVAKMVQIVPQISQNLVDTQMTTRLAILDFYKANDDLLPHKKYVGFVSNELYAKNPDWSLDKNLEETEKEVRVRLKLVRTANPGTGGVNQQTRVNHTVENNPGFVPSGGGGRRGSGQADKLSGEDTQIIDLIS